ncbi:hypothetical protein PLESTF_000732700 [Pleodorina starrii]|nr:hypothetical protein PLESTF_000732700 [Pleodorina starrii]
MCRDIDGSYCGYLAAKEELLSSMTSPEDHVSLLRMTDSQLPACWLPLLAQKLHDAPLSKLPPVRSLPRFWSPGGVVLVGDAAHTVTPLLGQGLNSALEDCELLAGEMREAGRSKGEDAPGTIDAALRRFSDSRAPDVRALLELELLLCSSLTPISAAPKQLLPRLQLLARKWAMSQYIRMLPLARAFDTATAKAAANRRKRRAQQQQQQQQQHAGEKGQGGHTIRSGTSGSSGSGSGSGGGGGSRRSDRGAQVERGGRMAVEAAAEVVAEGAAAAEAAAAADADVLAVQLDTTYVRSPPMYELLRGHMSYRQMLVRVYGMAALGTGASAALLYGLIAAAGALAGRVLAG